MIGKIHSIETFGTVDGPGIRYVIFTQGCPFRCAYCHNPDTWNINNGTDRSVDELLEDVVRYKRYIEGITVSGGEPMLQMDFLTELFKKTKALGLTTCLDTSGSVFDKSNPELMSKIDEMLKYCDLVMLDIKHIDEEKHIDLTGKTNKNVLEFASYLDSKNINIWLRYVLVPTINSDREYLIKWKEFADTLQNLKKIELLPYHTMGVVKYENLGIPYRLKDIQEPSKELISEAKKIFGID